MAVSRQPAATLTMTRGPGAGRSFDIGAAAVTIGRVAQNDVQVEGTWVSRRHARIAWTGTEYIVEDLGSTNGTFVNGERVGVPRALRSGDFLQLGEQVELAFEVRVPAPVHEEPALPGMAPSPIGSAGSPLPYAPPSEPVPAQKESFLRRKSTRVWALALLGVLLILIAGGVAYYLLSDGGQQVADTPAEQAGLPEPTSTPTPIPPAPTATPAPVIAQANAILTGPMTISSRGENASAEGAEIEFTTSADGGALVSMSYSLLEGKCTYRSASSSTTITGSSKSTLYFNEPVPITNGEFVIDFMGVQAKGNLTSPSEAYGEITIDEEGTTTSPSYQTYVCQYGTWTWTASVE